LALTTLAERAGMSLRTFCRRYRRGTGRTPSEGVELIRLERARQLLEEGASVTRTATRCGFRSTETMRRAFLRHLGVGPSAYRDRFHGWHGGGDVRQVWAIRFWLDRERRVRDPAMGDLAVDGRLRGCGLIIHRRTGRPVQFGSLTRAGTSVLSWPGTIGGIIDDCAIPRRRNGVAHITPPRRLHAFSVGGSKASGCAARTTEPLPTVALRHRRSGMGTAAGACATCCTVW